MVELSEKDGDYLIQHLHFNLLNRSLMALENKIRS